MNPIARYAYLQSNRQYFCVACVSRRCTGNESLAQTDPKSAGLPSRAALAMLLFPYRLELYNSVAGRNRVRPRLRNVLIEFVIGTGPEIGEARKHKWNSL